jgi:hypothetical protein
MAARAGEHEVLEPGSSLPGFVEDDEMKMFKRATLWHKRGLRSKTN